MIVKGSYKRAFHQSLVVRENVGLGGFFFSLCSLAASANARCPGKWTVLYGRTALGWMNIYMYSIIIVLDLFYRIVCFNATTQI